MFGASHRPAPGRSLRRFGSALLTTLALVIPPVLALPTAALATEHTATAAAQTNEVTIEIAVDPLSATTVTTDSADSTVQVHGTVQISATQPLAAGQIILSHSALITTVTAQNEWLSGSLGSSQPGTDAQLATLATPEISAGSQGAVEFTVQLPVTVSNGAPPEQVYGLSAQYRGGEDTYEGRGMLLVPGATTNAPVQLSTIVPVTAPLGQAALVSANELAMLTAPDGALTELLATVRDTNATLAIDPRLLVSIRALGTDAPQSATAWLSELATLDNPSFPLEFADANTELLSELNLTDTLSADAFAFATRKHSFAAEALPQTTPTASSDPSDQPQTNADTKPSTEALTAFNYTRPDLVWPLAENPQEPAEGQVAVLDSNALANGPSLTAGNLYRAGSGRALVVNATVNDLFTRAVQADTEAKRNAALAELTTTLALSRSVTSLPVTLVAGRDPLSANGYAAVIAALRNASVIETVAVPSVGSAVSGEVTVNAKSLSPQVHEGAQQLLQQKTAGDTLVTLYDDPEDVRQELQINLLRAISNQQLSAGTFSESVASYSTFATGALSGVSLESGSNVQLIGHETSIPVFVSNQTNRPVTVTVRAHANTGHLRVTNTTTVRIEANSSSRAQIPVTAIANGTSELTVTLWANTTVQLPSVSSFEVFINADLETVTIVILIALLVLLVGFGTWRTVRKRARTRGRARLRRSLQSPQSTSADEFVARDSAIH